ncbi:MAG: LysR family transcriptional regulator [Alphaproteobacteria bacterium]|nr:LysR family transcriptional regulator [Alphaproteobacteria bacterium]
MLDWDKLRIFYTVAHASSFTQAGETLHLSQSAVSRQISALEESLSVVLFHRHARGLLLTEQGEILLQTVKEVYGRLAAVEDAVRESKDRPKGSLKITTPVTFGTTWLTPRINEFIELYPEIDATLVVDDRELDLSMREADVAIRPFASTQPDLIQRQLVVFHHSVYASHEYLQRMGVPQKPEDLANHRLIGFSEEGRLPFSHVNWLLEAGLESGAPRHKPAFRVNSLMAMLRAVESGVGIAAFPDYMLEGLPHVAQILPELPRPSTNVYFVYPSELRHSKRVIVFRDFIIRKLSESRF